MKDIGTRDDLVILLNDFYSKAINDDLIGHFFTKVIPLNLETHVPVIADFWETILLNGRSYTKNAVLPHMHINRLSAMEKKHFDRWLLLFTESVDNYFQGENAETAKQRALSIATVIQIRISNASTVNFKNK